MNLIHKIYLACFLIYIPVIIGVTFFFPRRERTSKTYEYHYIPLQSTIAQIKDPAQYNTPGYWQMFTVSIAGNVLLFVPLGFFFREFSSAKNATVFLYTVAVSVCIELLQLIFHLGVCDIDDVILNSAGSFLGICINYYISRYYSARFVL